MEEEYANTFKFFKDDTIFHSINKHFISLQDEEIKKNNEHLRRIVTEGLIPIMKTNNLFNEMYKKINYAGSFYKGTKVSKPNEYDLDLIVQLPLNYATVELETEHEHYGYVKIKVDEKDKLPEWKKHGKILNKWINQGYLDQNKFRRWMESIMTKTFEQIEKNDKVYELTVDDETYVLKAFTKNGPAFTLHIRLKGDPDEMRVKLVPSLEFNGRLLDNYRVIPDMVPTFVVIPKPLGTLIINGNNLWRVSFSEQEKQLLSEKEFSKMKPVIRMLKKIRDKENMTPIIASYFIETLCLHEIMSRKSDVQFFRGPLTGLFIFMLRKLSEAIRAKRLYFFWHEEHNLLSNLDANVMENYGNRFRNILSTIEKRYLKNRFVIAEHVLSVQEFADLLIKIAEENSGASVPSVQPAADENSASSSQAEDGTFDVKPYVQDIVDSMLKKHNFDELSADDVELFVRNTHGELPADVVEEIKNACKKYVREEEGTGYFGSLTRFLNKLFSPKVIVEMATVILSGLNERKHRETAENSNVRVRK